MAGRAQKIEFGTGITTQASFGATEWFGGRGKFIAVGTFNGSTATLEFLAPDGTTWVSYAAGLTADGHQEFFLPRTQVRLTTSAANPTTLAAWAVLVDAQ